MKVSIGKINTSIWFRCMKKKSLMEDKRNNEVQRPLTRRNPKRHIPLVSLLLWYKIVVARFFVWALGLRLWSVRQWVRWILRLGNFFKSLLYIRSPVSDFVILKLYLILDGLILLRKGDFCCEAQVCDGFWRWHFRQRAQDMGQSLLKQYGCTVWYCSPAQSMSSVLETH